MFVARVRSSGKNGKSYESVLLRESFRKGSKVASRTLAVLTKLPAWLIKLIEAAVAKDRSGARNLRVSPGSDASEKLDAAEKLCSSAALLSLGEHSRCPVSFRQSQSFGALWLVRSLADKLGISKALRFGDVDPHQSELALWRVCARVLRPGISLLGMTRLASTGNGNSAASRLFDWQRSWCEDDLYAQGSWLESRHSEIEKSLWKHGASLRGTKRGTPAAPGTDNEELFLYDVTSSYLEGRHNALAAFGYNRDQKKGKMQVVVGLLTDAGGEPCAVRVYEGSKRDFHTFGDAVNRVKDDFGCKHVVFVGDRGMIKAEQIKEARDQGFRYISALTKPQINRMLKSGLLQMELFDQSLAEVSDTKSGERYILRRNPVRQQQIAENRGQRQAKMQAMVEKSNVYLREHPKAKTPVQVRRINEGLAKLRLKAFLSVRELEGKRALELSVDEEALLEVRKLDGCYVLRTDLEKKDCRAETVHQRYKDLSEVEADFRTMKTGHLELRPWNVTREDNTHVHALTAMLSLKIRRHLYAAWEKEDLTVEEGLRELEALCLLEITEKKTGKSNEILPEPSSLQKRLLKTAGVALPKRVPSERKTVVVGTRKKLPSERKANQPS